MVGKNVGPKITSKVVVVCSEGIEEPVKKGVVQTRGIVKIKMFEIEEQLLLRPIDEHNYQIEVNTIGYGYHYNEGKI